MRDISRQSFEVQKCRGTPGMMHSLQRRISKILTCSIQKGSPVECVPILKFRSFFACFLPSFCLRIEGKEEDSNEVKLQYYSLYKQAINGDNTASQPWAVQVAARAKWDGIFSILFT